MASLPSLSHAHHSCNYKANARNLKSYICQLPCAPKKLQRRRQLILLTQASSSSSPTNGLGSRKNQKRKGRAHAAGMPAIIPQTETPKARADGDCSSALPFHVNSITSTSNPFVKHCVKLRNSSSYRHSHGSVLLVGITPLREIYNFQESMHEMSTTIDCLLLHDKAEIPKELVDSSIHVVRINSAVIKKLSGIQSTESVEAISLVRIPSTFRTLHDTQHGKHFLRWFPSAHRILVLDGIQDPGNLGTLLRSAVAFGWDGVFLLPGCCDPFNEKALRASRGASFQLVIVLGTWSHLQSLVNGFRMKILAGHPGINNLSKPVSRLSQQLAESFIDHNLCLVLGSEGSGLSEKTREVSELVTITMAGKFESLNVSVAGGIFLHMLQLQNNHHHGSPEML